MKRQNLIALRSPEPTISPDGTVEVGTKTQVPFRASIQPADRKQLESYPFLRDFRQLYTLFSDTELLTARAEVSECDTVEVYGVTFDVMTCEAWQNKVRSHYKIRIGR